MASPMRTTSATNSSFCKASSQASAYLLVAASLAGFAAQWLTEWYTYDAHIQSLFEIGDHEDIAGFIYIGSASSKPDERPRPETPTRIRRWQAQNEV